MSLTHSDFEVLEVISTKGKKNNIRILKARQTKSKEIVCLKTFRSHKFSVVQEALQEAKILMSASDHHQNICKMHDCFIEQVQEHFRFGIVMQHFDLGDLEDEIKRRKRANRPWAESELNEAFSGLVDALSVLQKNHICHRDLKPQNIFVEGSNHYKIGDFGLSKKECLGKLSTSRTLVGTPIYFSPLCAEAYLNNQLYGETKVRHNMYKSDVFSLGLTFLRMASLTSIRGLNVGTQGNIGGRISKLGYSDAVRGLIYQMLKLDESVRPDFIALSSINSELNGILLSIQPDHIAEETEETQEEVMYADQGEGEEKGGDEKSCCEDCREEEDYSEVDTVAESDMEFEGEVEEGEVVEHGEVRGEEEEEKSEIGNVKKSGNQKRRRSARKGGRKVVTIVCGKEGELNQVSQEGDRNGFPVVVFVEGEFVEYGGPDLESNGDKLCAKASNDCGNRLLISIIV